MLVNLRAMLQAARQGGYAVAAFNVDNLEIIEPLVRAAELERAPVIIQGGPVGLDHAGWEEVGAVVRLAAERASVPVALHLDHGASLEQVQRALAAGFTSVMLDGSNLPEAEKLELTRQTVALARARGASVEAELGAIAGSEEGVSVADEAARFTEPAEAAAFVAATGVDCLAVSIGNVHWVSDQPTVLDLERLRAIRDAVPVPLVLHGGSGVDDATLARAVAAGLSKLNIATATNKAFVEGLRSALDRAFVETTPGRRRVHPHKLFLAARAAVCEAARGRIRVLGASGRVG